jgi:hypothetical protein
MNDEKKPTVASPIEPVVSADFFVMLYTQKGSYTPLMDCTSIANDTVEFAKFKTKEEAREGALGSVLGEQFGYEIFEIGYGDS